MSIGLLVYSKSILSYRGDTLLIDFLEDGTCIQTYPSIEFKFDWFYRDSPKQILLTQVDEVWPQDYLYDFVEMTANSQIWENKVETPWYTDLHKYFLTRK